MTLSISLTAFAVEIPIESIPHNATHEGMIITENLIGEILTEVKNGLGFKMRGRKQIRRFSLQF